MTVEHALNLQALGLLGTYRRMSPKDRWNFVRHIYRLEPGTEQRRAGLKFLKLKAEEESKGAL